MCPTFGNLYKLDSYVLLSLFRILSAIISKFRELSLATGR